MSAPDHIVFVVDDDARLRAAICDLLASVDLHAVAFGSIGGFIAFDRPDLPGCLVLDVNLPDASGLEFQRRNEDGVYPPIVFITGQGDIPSSVAAIKRGAVDFLTKPFDDEGLIAAVRAAIAQDRIAREERAELDELRRRLDLLTPREREVLPLVVSGLLNKQAAAELGISEITLQIHRGKIMQKMAADSLADLVRIAGKLGVPVTHSRRSGVL